MRTKKSISENLLSVLNYIFLMLFAFVTIFPFVNVLAVSLSSSRAIISGEVFLKPVELTFAAYKNLIDDGQLIYALRNTVIITLVGTVINMVATIAGAYPLSKNRLKGHKIFMGLIVFTMLFDGGLIPTFILLKNLGLMNHYGALWLPGMLSVYNMIIMISFFRGIPTSLEEAAEIDGANDMYKLVKIVIPLSMPVIASLALFYAVGWWNNYFNVLIYITDSKKLSITVKLMQMINNMSSSLMNGEGTLVQDKLIPEAVKAAAIIFTATPILCVYPFLQKYFVKGIMIGSIKG